MEVDLTHTTTTHITSRVSNTSLLRPPDQHAQASVGERHRLSLNIPLFAGETGDSFLLVRLKVRLTWASQAAYPGAAGLPASSSSRPRGGSCWKPRLRVVMLNSATWRRLCRVLLVTREKNVRTGLSVRPYEGLLIEGSRMILSIRVLALDVGFT